MTTAILAPDFIQHFCDNSGAPLAFGKIYTYAAGTSTKQVSYTDSSGNAPNTNPIILNVRGECNLWLDPTLTYKIVLAYPTDSDPPTNPIKTVDNIQGPLAIGGSLIPTADNTFTLGNPNFSFANLYLGPNSAPVFDPTTGNVGYYAPTAAEIFFGAVITDPSFPPYPYVDPRRYGADPGGVTLSTAAVQTAINVAYRSGGIVWIGQACNFLCGALSLTFTGTRDTNSLRIMGGSVAGSRLSCSGNPATFLSFQGPTPSSTPGEAPLTLENLSISSPFGSTADGLLINGLGGCQIKAVNIKGFANGINLNSALGILIDQQCTIENCTTGILIRQNGSGSTANLIRINNTVIGACSSWAIDFDEGSELQLNSCDIEDCGSVGNVTTGSIHIGANLEPGFGFAKVRIQNCWLEGSRGQGILVDAQVGGSSLNLVIEGGWTIGSDSGRAININGAANLAIRDHISPSAGDTWVITATSAVIENGGPAVLTDTGITYPTYINVTTSTQSMHAGRISNFTGTLTGVSGTAPTGTVTVIQQGDEITLEFNQQISGTSNSNAATITGLPTAYKPVADTNASLTVIDNGVVSILACLISASTGVITLGNGHTFATSGAKGLGVCSARYRIP